MAKMLCRGCGRDFGYVPKSVRCGGRLILDVCPTCVEKEKKSSERLTRDELPSSLPVGDFRRMREVALESLKRQVDELPALPLNKSGGEWVKPRRWLRINRGK